MKDKDIYDTWQTMWEYYKVYCVIYYKTWIKPFWMNLQRDEDD